MNCPHKSPAPEVMVVGKEYAFSYNPDMLIDPKDTGTDYCIRARRFIVTNLRLRYSTIDIIPEISSQGRIHFHGTIKLGSIVSFFLEDIPVLKKHGTYEIDVINNPDTWTVYVMKFYEVFESYWSNHCPKEKTFNICTDTTGTQWKRQTLLDAKRRITDAAATQGDVQAVSEKGGGSGGIPRLKPRGPKKEKFNYKKLNILDQ